MNLCNCFGKNNDLLLILVLYYLICCCDNGCDNDCKGSHGCLGC